jgi:PKD repeat protein
VTDAAGLTAQASQTVTVLAVAAPAIKLEVAPESPFVNLQSVFTATATAGIGHSIVRYEWNFGDNTTATTTVPTIIKTFTDVGRFVVTVTAVDDTGQTGSAAKSVVVGFSIDPPVARFVVAPSSPRAGVQVTFNGSTSSVGVGATIVNYQWSFGDPGGIPVDTGTTPAVVFTYLTPGTYIATLTVTDSLFRQGTATVTVTVAP